MPSKCIEQIIVRKNRVDFFTYLAFWYTTQTTPNIGSRLCLHTFLCKGSAPAQFLRSPPRTSCNLQVFHTTINPNKKGKRKRRCLRCCQQRNYGVYASSSSWCKSRWPKTPASFKGEHHRPSRMLWLVMSLVSFPPWSLTLSLSMALYTCLHYWELEDPSSSQ